MGVVWWVVWAVVVGAVQDPLADQSSVVLVAGFHDFGVPAMTYPCDLVWLSGVRGHVVVASGV